MKGRDEPTNKGMKIGMGQSNGCNHLPFSSGRGDEEAILLLGSGRLIIPPLAYRVYQPYAIVGKKT